MFCPSCGNQVEETAQFCPKCGVNIKQPSTIPPITPQPVVTPSTGKASSRATTSLVLGILGLVCCGILAPIAWAIGAKELKEIKAGLSAEAGKGFANAGMILGIIGTVFLILGIIWLFFWILFFGGMATLGGMRHF